MKTVTKENGISLAGKGNPLGVHCACCRRALIQQNRLSERIGPASINKIRDLRWFCSKCGSRRIELLMFSSQHQADAFRAGLSYAALFDLRLHGKDLTQEPWCRLVDRPNPYTDGPHDPPNQRAGAADSTRIAMEGGVTPESEHV